METITIKKGANTPTRKGILHKVILRLQKSSNKNHPNDLIGHMAKESKDGRRSSLVVIVKNPKGVAHNDYALVEFTEYDNVSHARGEVLGKAVLEHSIIADEKKGTLGYKLVATLEGEEKLLILKVFPESRQFTAIIKASINHKIKKFDLAHLAKHIHYTFEQCLSTINHTDRAMAETVDEAVRVLTRLSNAGTGEGKTSKVTPTEVEDALWGHISPTSTEVPNAGELANTVQAELNLVNYDGENFIKEVVLEEVKESQAKEIELHGISKESGAKIVELFESKL